MAVLGILKLDNKEYRLITFDLKSTQPVDKTGKPSQRPSGLLIDLVIESDSDTSLLQWALGNEPKDGIITFYKADGMSKFSEVKFQKAYCVSLAEKFEANGTLPMRQIITISEPRREEVKEVIAPPKQTIRQEAEEIIEDKTYVDGHFYSIDGIYLGKIGSGNNVYITDKSIFLELEKGNNVEKEKIVFFTEKYELNNEQLLDRANWAYAEGKGFAPEYYAFAMNNFKKVAGGEKEMYYWGMQDTDPITKKVRRLNKDKYLSGGYENQSGKVFWELRKYLSKMSPEMQAEIAAVFKTQISPDSDPTNGCNQWRGGKGSGEIQLNAPLGSKYWHRFFKLKKAYSGQAKIITI
ncbi:type VI secretion system tube protein TssD [Flavobacterium sp. MC2016-06]|jgi:hypothetical protein|uniref:type VI secretion system tube protein TssD n=1 Tax=Flavobacterium sp. MC2016-06 TaxID=2676308 RepID=UPI0012BAD98E|nr:type VI secretion system tube protein TssD [Flavobacterium sp. MC2016-06]MBU3859282.1 hypothetical protein [Flavobacterium sp. MC2016-06]